MSKQTKSEYLLVNIPKWYLYNSRAITIQHPEYLKKYFGYIVSSFESYENTVKKLKKAGYQMNLNNTNDEEGIDGSYGGHLLCEILDSERPHLKTIRLEDLCLIAKVESKNQG